MPKNHLKTIAAPRSWNVQRKSKIFVLRPDAGPHSINNSITLNFLLIDLLKIANTKKEVKYILNNKGVAVDGKLRKERAFPIGLFDVVTIKDINKNFRIMMDEKGRFYPNEISESEINIKPCKIVGKTIVRKKIQLNTFDGKNILVDKNEYVVGDTIVIGMHEKKIKDHFKLEKGNTIFLTSGKQMGNIGTVEDIIENKIIYKTKDGVFETLKKYAYVVGKEKPIIKI